MKVTIPVLVSRTGAVVTGYFSRDAKGKTEIDHRTAVDCMDDADYDAGYVVVHVEAEIDEEELARRLTAKGEAKFEPSGQEGTR